MKHPSVWFKLSNEFVRDFATSWSVWADLGAVPEMTGRDVVHY